jgi:multidrug efflux pump
VIPVALLGTFIGLYLLHFSLNQLTLFGMVLAIGIVVDDAIVVLENVEHHLSTGLDAKSATIKAMDEITGPIMAITLVLCSVFLPSVFMPGISGQFFRQFALVISSAMVISAINALTLTPSRAVAIFSSEELDEHGHPRREALPWWIFALLGGVISAMLLHGLIEGWIGASAGDSAESSAAEWLSWVAIAIAAVPGLAIGAVLGKTIIQPVNKGLSRLFGAFNRLFDRFADLYGRTIARLLRGAFVVIVVYVGLLVLTGWSMNRAPKGFIPMQDQGYLLVNVQLPDSASVQRTKQVMAQIDRIALGDAAGKDRIPGVAHTLSIAGQSFLLNANGSNFGSCFVTLEDFSHRHAAAEYDEDIAQTLRKRFAAEIDDAQVQVFRAPPIQGLGTAGGFKLQVEQRGYSDLIALQRQCEQLVAVASKDRRLVGLFSMFRAGTPQIFLEIDRSKCQLLGVNVNEVFNTLEVYMGGYFINLFNAFGRTWQVNMMAESRFRDRVADLQQLQVRNSQGQMVPLGTLVKSESVGGPVMVIRYNMYTSAPVVGNPAEGTSSGDVVKIIESKADQAGLLYEWTEIMYLQLQEGSGAIVVFLIGSALVFFVLAAKYESWKLPMAVILVVPMCLLCSVEGMMLRALPIDIFVQIGFLVLVGLAAKNAILIVEFAAQLVKDGKPLLEATVEAARLRLRPIVMTSLAFILGVVPLMLGEGAGAEMRRSLGTAVFAGMIGVTAFGVVLTPVFFYVIMRRSSSTSKPAAAESTKPPSA